MSTVPKSYSVVHPGLRRALQDARGANTRLAVAAGFTHPSELGRALGAPFRLTPLTAGRLARLAELLGHAGPATRVLTAAQFAEWQRDVARQAARLERLVRR